MAELEQPRPGQQEPPVQSEATPGGPLAHRTLESRRCQALVERLHAWVLAPHNRRWLEQVTRAFFPPRPTGVAGWETEWLHWVFLSYLVHDHTDAAGRTARERFIAEADPPLSATDRRLLAAPAAEPFRLVEVCELVPGEGMVVEDLLGGGRFELTERRASRTLTRWDLLIVRLRPLSGRVELDAACSVPRAVRLPLLEAIQRLLPEARRVQPQAGPAEVLRQLAPQVFQALLASLRVLRQPPLLQTSDGDPLLFCAARYAVLDRAGLSAALDRHRSLAASESGYAWRSGQRRVGPQAGTRTTLGLLTWAGEELVLETNSRHRLARGRALLAKLEPGLLRHLLDSFEDPQQAVERLRRRPLTPTPGDAPVISAQQKAQIEQQVLAEHYARWVDEPLPHLDGRTPRQATAHPALAARLTALLKDFEHRSARGGGPRFDYGQLWTRLGLRREEERGDDEERVAGAPLRPTPTGG